MNITQILTTALSRVKTYVDTQATNIKKLQADWNVTDTSNKAYIHNKPETLPADGGNVTTLDGIGIMEIDTDYYLSLSNFGDKIYILDGEVIIEDDTPVGGDTGSVGDEELLDLSAFYYGAEEFTIAKGTINIHGGGGSVSAQKIAVGYKFPLDTGKTFRFTCTSPTTGAIVEVRKWGGAEIYYGNPSGLPVNWTSDGGYYYIAFYTSTSSATVTYTNISLRQVK